MKLRMCCCSASPPAVFQAAQAVYYHYIKAAWSCCCFSFNFDLRPVASKWINSLDIEHDLSLELYCHASSMGQHHWQRPSTQLLGQLCLDTRVHGREDTVTTTLAARSAGWRWITCRYSMCTLGWEWIT